MTSEVFKDIPKEFWEDRKWADENHSELVKKYPNKWVAIVDKKVVAVSDGTGRFGRFLEEAKRKTGRQYIPTIFVDAGNIYVY
jgi:hypothetical protein